MVGTQRCMNAVLQLMVCELVENVGHEVCDLLTGSSEDPTVPHISNCLRDSVHGLDEVEELFELLESRTADSGSKKLGLRW